LVDVRALAFAALVIAASAMAAGACEALRDGPRATVTAVRDGDTVLLDTGAEVRLVGTQAPKLPLGREDFETWPMAGEAQQALEEIVLRQKVILRYGGEDTDRHGRILAQVFVVSADREVWVQEEMLSAGMARVYSFPDNRSCLAELLAAEGRARAMKLGIWTDPYYSVRRADRPEALLDRIGQYELVEGRVLLAERSGALVYLNFGRRWKEDFTAVIDARSLKLFTGSGLDPLVLEGALVRVRGWVESYDGPRIAVSHPEQIEVLATR
jgi:endonuclease YncB( thermonuclease family)